MFQAKKAATEAISNVASRSSSSATLSRRNNLSILRSCNSCFHEEREKVADVPGLPEHKPGLARSQQKETAMASNARIFFAGVGTTFIILSVGFGGGLMMAKTSLEPSAPSRSVPDRMPSPVRVVFPPASAERASPSQTSASALSLPVPEPVAAPPKQTQQAAEMDKHVERIERHKAEAEERARRKRYAERKARREAARLAQQRQEQQAPRLQPGIMASGGDDDQPRSGGLFGN